MKISTSINIIVLLLCVSTLNACKSINLKEPVKANLSSQSTEEKVVIEKIQNNPGVSSTTVERLAIKNQCEPIELVNLLTPRGPVEIYRATCSNGKIIMARCELRQCTIMPSKE
jgi:hypothetical protein